MDYPGVDFLYQGNKYFYSRKHHGIYRSHKNARGVSSGHPGGTRERSDVAISGIWLNISKVCNLNCRYCFVPPVKDDAGKKESQWMTKEIAQKAIILLGKLWKKYKNNRPASIVFFGGEPLLNFKVFEHSVYFAREWTRISNIPFLFSLSTNGTLLNQKFIDFFRTEHVALQVSLDGSRASNDYNRKFHSGTGSYKTIMSNVKRLFSVISPASVNIRSTIAKGAAPLSATIGFFIEEGFKRIEFKFMSDNNQSGAGVKESELEMLRKDADAAVDALMKARSFGVNIQPFQEHLMSLKRKHWRNFICGAGKNVISVDTEGWIYPCHRFHGNPGYRISHVTGSFDSSISREFAGLQSEEIEPCSSCWATKFCCGCCPAESVAFEKPPGHPHPQWCKMKRLEAEISLKAAVAAGLVEDA